MLREFEQSIIRLGSTPLEQGGLYSTSSTAEAYRKLTLERGKTIFDKSGVLRYSERIIGIVQNGIGDREGDARATLGDLVVCSDGTIRLSARWGYRKDVVQKYERHNQIDFYALPLANQVVIESGKDITSLSFATRHDRKRMREAIVEAYRFPFSVYSALND